jgi:NAD(P)-dependent dehydrogenase (short-subunit alcohol dehydrogenase family)
MHSSAESGETTLEDARAQIETNFFGAVRMMEAVLPGMREQGSGRIVNISSISSVIGMPCAFSSSGVSESHS